MKALRVTAAFVAASVTLAALSTCKPIGYYLAQVYKVYGQVTVEGTSPPEPIGSVEVFVGDWQYSELTNYNGDYEMEMAAGTWTVHFVRDGYLSKSVEGVTVGPDNPRYALNVALTRIGPQNGTITVRLTGADAYNGLDGVCLVVATGAEVSPDTVIGVANWPIAAGTAEGVVEESGDAVDPIIFAGGQLCDVYAYIDLEGDDFPTMGDWWAGPKTVEVDGDTVVEFTFPDDFEVVTVEFPFLWELNGTWANARYDAEGEEPEPMAKLVICAGDETVVADLYANTGDAAPVSSNEMQITDDWTVGQTRWFQSPLDSGEGYLVMRISEANTVLEIASSDIPFPEDIDPEAGGTYVIYYRQE